MVDIATNPLYFAAIGGLMLGIGTSVNYALRGKVTGMSGLLFGIASLNLNEIPEKISILGGMLVMSGLFFDIFGYGTSNGFTPFGPASQIAQKTSYLGFALSGFLVGFGTKLSNGCTSGHGLCGLARFSPRSLVAVAIFFSTAIAISTFRYYLTLGPFSTEQPADGIQYNHLISANIFIAIGLLLPILGGILKTRNNELAKAEEQNRNNQKAKQFQMNLENTEEKPTQQKSAIIIDQILTFIIGVLFGAGLLVAGMARRTNILDFLALGQGWNPSLLFVFACGLLLNIIVFSYMIHIRKQPFLAEKLFNPNNTTIDVPLVLGAFCFGLGWGIGGLCPGPLFVLSAVWNIPIHVVWFSCLLLGMLLAFILDKKFFSKKVEIETDGGKASDANIMVTDIVEDPDTKDKINRNNQDKMGDQNHQPVNNCQSIENNEKIGGKSEGEKKQRLGHLRDPLVIELKQGVFKKEIPIGAEIIEVDDL